MSVDLFEANTTYGINVAGKVDEADYSFQLSSRDKLPCHEGFHLGPHLALVVPRQAQGAFGSIPNQAKPLDSLRRSQHRLLLVDYEAVLLYHPAGLFQGRSAPLST